MTDLENPHIARRIVNSVKNSIIAHANPPAWFQFPPQHLDPSWPGVLRQSNNRGVDPFRGCFRKLFQLLGSASVDEDSVFHNLPARFSRRRTSSYGTSFLEVLSARSRASASSRSSSFRSIRRYWFISSKTASLRPLVPTTNFGAVPIREIIALAREAVHAGKKRRRPSCKRSPSFPLRLSALTWNCRSWPPASRRSTTCPTRIPSPPPSPTPGRQPWSRVIRTSSASARPQDSLGLRSQVFCSGDL